MKVYFNCDMNKIIIDSLCFVFVVIVLTLFSWWISPIHIDTINIGLSFHILKGTCQCF